MLRRLWGRLAGRTLSPVARMYYRRPRLRRLVRRFMSPLPSIPLPAVEMSKGPLDGMKLALDGQVLSHYLDADDHEDHMLSLIRANVPAGATVVDGGANIGYFSLILSRLVGERGRVFAFEPDPVVARGLERNVALNRLTGRIIPHNKALSAEAGEIRFDAAGDMVSRVVSDESEAGVGQVISVPCVTLDSVFPAGGGNAPDPAFVKVDVEGHEFAVLRGAAGVLGRARPFIFLEAHHARAYTDCVRFLRGLGYAIKPLTNQPDADRLNAIVDSGGDGVGAVTIPVHLWCAPS